MVLRFLKERRSGLDAVEDHVTGMLTDCRHTFDVAMAALFTEGDVSALGDDVRSTDTRINAAEESVRRALVVHAAVKGTDDVGLVLAYLLIVKKLERVGDQHKNIFDLAEEGVRLSGAEDAAVLQSLRSEISALFAETNRILVEEDHEAAHALTSRVTELRKDMDQRVASLLHTELPGREAVPRALLFRYLKRIAANLAGVVATLLDGIDRSEYDSSGADVTDD